LFSPQINWLSYLAHAFGLTDVEITEDERVIVVEPEYLDGLLPLLAATPAKTQGKNASQKRKATLHQKNSDEKTQDKYAHKIKCENARQKRKVKTHSKKTPMSKREVKTHQKPRKC
jgi:hypothetical protein